jgi:tRNA(Arg) A34 adenosine deaminase TadA
MQEMQNFSEIKLMERALQLAEQAAQVGEVPVGAVIVNEAGEVIAEARNSCESESNPLRHAEINALNIAFEKNKNNNFNKLEGCDIIVTLEPCAMCAAAISASRIKKLIYAAEDVKSGGVDNGAKIFDHKTCHHKPEIISGIKADESKLILKKFFSELRLR